MANLEELPIDALVPDASNPRVHDPRNRRAIAASLRQFGAGRSIVLDGSNVVRAGNGTVEQAQAEGFDRVLVVEPDPGQIVAVRRRDWTPSQATAYGIADNRTTDLSTFDDTAVVTLLEALRSEPDFPTEATGFDDAEVQALLARLADTALAAAGDDDRPAPAEPEEPEDPTGPRIYPLAILLSRAELRRWQGRKAELDLTDDTEAFLRVAGL